MNRHVAIFGMVLDKKRDFLLKLKLGLKYAN